MQAHFEGTLSSSREYSKTVRVTLKVSDFLKRNSSHRAYFITSRLENTAQGLLVVVPFV